MWIWKLLPGLAIAAVFLAAVVAAVVPAAAVVQRLGLVLQP